MTSPNPLASFDGLSMSSLEIAERTKKDHKNVLRDIRAMLVELHGPGGALSFEHTRQNGQNGQRYPFCLLPKRECMILVTGYSIPLRAAVVDRWQELEDEAAARANPLTAVHPIVVEALQRLSRQVAETQTQFLAALDDKRIHETDSAIIRGVTAGQVLDMAGITDHRRLKGVAQAISARLRRFAGTKGVVVQQASLCGASVFIFPKTLVLEWLADGGRSFIDGKVRERRGQTVLALVGGSARR